MDERRTLRVGFFLRSSMDEPKRQQVCRDEETDRVVIEPMNDEPRALGSS